MAKTTKCHGCQEHFQDHDECLAHLATNKACQAEIKILGKTFCFVCDRSYEKVRWRSRALLLTNQRASLSYQFDYLIKQYTSMTLLY